MNLVQSLALSLSGALVLSLSACTASSGQTNLPQSDPAVSSTAETAGGEQLGETYPLTLTDQAGRQVTLTAEPQRLVTSYYISTSLLIALGLQDRVVGVENQPEKRPVYALSAPQLLQLPSIGTAKELDLEGCAALQPDLVILPLKLSGSADSLEALGIPVLFINPENQALLEQAITLVGQATNTQNRAEQLIAFTDQQQTLLQTLLEGADRPRVYLGGNSDFLSTAGAAMYQSALIDIAGGSNVAAEITDTYWAQTSYEQILAWDPEYIILASDASYTVEDVLDDPNLAGCTAVEQGQVYQIPGDVEAWDSPVPGGILGAVWLSGVLHPDLCPPQETRTIVKDFYQTFYGFSWDETL